MSRRSALPGAAELFRSTGDSRPGPQAPAPARRVAGSGAGTSADRPADDVPEPAAGKAQQLLSGTSQDRPDDAPPGSASAGERPAAAAKAVRRRPASGTGRPAPTGRERHDEKITVYVSVEELMDLERARLTLRGEHGLAVDRGRIVREALAVVLADLEAEGEASTLVQRLRDR